MDSILWLWLAKVFGAFAGSAFSLAFVAPRSKQEAAIRLSCGLFFGTFFSAYAVDLLEKQFSLTAAGAHEREIIGASIASFIAWYLLDAVVRIVNGFKALNDLKNNREPE